MAKIKEIDGCQIVPNNLVRVDKDGTRHYEGSVEWVDAKGQKWKSTRYFTVAKGMIDDSNDTFIDKIMRRFGLKK